MTDQESLNEPLTHTDLERTLHQLLTVETSYDNGGKVTNVGELSDSEIIQGKHLTLESILNGSDIALELDPDADNNDRKRICTDNDQTLPSKKRNYVVTAGYDQHLNLLSPVSLSPSSTDDSTQRTYAGPPSSSGLRNGSQELDSPAIHEKAAEQAHTSQALEQNKGSVATTNAFTMAQVLETKKRIINTHKLILNFNFLKDGYARTCVEFKKSMHSLRDSEIRRAHLMEENEELRNKIKELTEKLDRQEAVFQP
ncbi:ATC1 (YDR184C) [Zygosaccharomyces parabailii]|nr:ATC1 (YDR184C) [Zygosaccharomyces parabailii]CDH09516.1 uncharacterized protein ZBAI_01300 [Zygosaccharomyces bailii ISA1307]